MGLEYLLFATKELGLDSIVRKYNSGFSIDLKNYNLDEILRMSHDKYQSAVMQISFH